MKRIILLTGLCILATSTFANAGGSTGGGNTDDAGNLVEDYVVENPTIIRGYGAYRERLEQLRKELPTLASMIDRQLGNMDWYSIPANIEELPSEATKLHFHTNQPVYQTQTEVFTSQKQLETIPEAKIGRLFLHEGVMSLQGGAKSAENVRPVTIRLLSEKASTQEKQEILLKNGFSGHFSAGELDLFAKEARKAPRLAELMEKDLKALVQACVDYNEHKASAPADYRAARSFSFRLVGTPEDLMQTLEEVPIKTGEVCQNALDGEVSRAVCMAHKDFNGGSGNISRQTKEGTQRELSNRLGRPNHRLLEVLANNESYITLLAIQSSHYENTFFDIPLNPGQDTKVLTKKIMTKVIARRKQIDFNQPNLSTIHCNAIQGLNNWLGKSHWQSGEAEHGESNLTGNSEGSINAN